MHIVEFTADTLRFAEQVPQQAPQNGFVWIFLERQELPQHWAELQQAAQQLGGSALLDLHCQDLENAAHPSHYDYTSVYDLIVFRRMATQTEMVAAAEREAAIAAYHGQPVKAQNAAAKPAQPALAAFHRIHSLAVSFAIFDHLLITVHPPRCQSAHAYVQRFLADAQHSVDAATARSRVPFSPADLTLRMINAMVDSYLEVRKELASQLEHWQGELLKPHSEFADWSALMGARNQLHVLEDLCEEQHDAMQEWLDSLREQPLAALAQRSGAGQSQRDQLVARARDVIEHIERVVHHVRRLEQSAETVVQIHFSVQGNRTNEIMKVLTTLTAIFLPLNLIAGIFGMNFKSMPLLEHETGFWIAMGGMVLIAVSLSAWFWRKRYLGAR